MTVEIHNYNVLFHLHKIVHLKTGSAGSGSMFSIMIPIYFLVPVFCPLAYINIHNPALFIAYIQRSL